MFVAVVDPAAVVGLVAVALAAGPVAALVVAGSWPSSAVA